MMGDSGGEQGRVKCVVWDLDGTIWQGTVLEDRRVVLKDEIVSLIKWLDGRGVVHSIASRNDPDVALAQLDKLGIAQYFLCPQINWLPKSTSVREIARTLNIATRAIAFVDDDPFDLREVHTALPDVLCVAADEVIGRARHSPEFSPRFITEESQQRREMYLTDLRRNRAEAEAGCSREEFLRSLGMELTIAEAAPEDLRRAEELTVRTSQLNTTGRVFSYSELDELCRSPDHLVMVATLTDRFGSHGKVGLTLVAVRPEVWTIQLLLVSCRVMSRGVGGVLLNQIMAMARRRGVRLRAEFVETGRNRIMYITYRFAGFREIQKGETGVLLEADPGRTPAQPDYIAVTSAL